MPLPALCIKRVPTTAFSWSSIRRRTPGESGAVASLCRADRMAACHQVEFRRGDRLAPDHHQIGQRGYQPDGCARQQGGHETACRLHDETGNCRREGATEIAAEVLDSAE